MFDSQHALEEAAKHFDLDWRHCRVIPKLIDGCAENPSCTKTPDAHFRLAVLGYVPMLGRLDEALDLLEKLRSRDPRFQLVVIGRPPTEFDFAAYRDGYSRIQETESLREAVEFRPAIAELAVLLKDVGWFASATDSEAYEVELAVGSATGTVPIILGAAPSKADQKVRRWVYATVDQAATAVSARDGRAWVADQAIAAECASEWSRQAAFPLWLELLGLADSKKADTEIDLYFE